MSALLPIAREIDGRPARITARPRVWGWQPAGLTRLEGAVVEALAYADVFDWPLSPTEIHRYLPVAATAEMVESVLARPSISRYIDERDGYVTLAGRIGLVPGRRRREALAARLRPRAIRFGLAVAALPFVRLVAVTGSLALDAATDAADVDLLIVTEEGRVWLTRALAMALVRAAALTGTTLCPNYLLAESSLRIEERSVFTAHELAQMVPIVPSDTYADLLAQNAWYREYLPNADARRPLTSRVPRRLGVSVRRAAEAALGSGFGDRLERWEMERKVRWLSRCSSSVETRYDATCCKGHTEAHGSDTLAAFDARLRRLEVIG